MARPKLGGLLLCEDKEHKRFFLRLLKKHFSPGRLRVESIPNNQGAGDAFVLEHYAKEVRSARRKRFENNALVVVIDGDRGKLQERLRQLDQKLTEAGLATRGPEERIAIFVPTRSIETWELWLCGHRDLDEDGGYKSRFRRAERRGEVSVKEAVAAWFQSVTSEEKAREEHRLPSLTAGRKEIGRLETRA